MAEAFARMHGGGIVQASSCGSKPAGRVDDKAIRLMREKGYDLASHQSKSLEDLPTPDFDVVISMGCGDRCPAVKAGRRIVWDIPDPVQLDDDDFRQARDDIERHVKALIHELSR